VTSTRRAKRGEGIPDGMHECFWSRRAMKQAVMYASCCELCCVNSTAVTNNSCRRSLAAVNRVKRNVGYIQCSGSTLKSSKGAVNMEFQPRPLAPAPPSGRARHASEHSRCQLALVANWAHCHSLKIMTRTQQLTLSCLHCGIIHVSLGC
jgi:hypothetical protein